MAFATLPSPLYGLYRERDGLSTFTITIVYAIWAAGTIAALIAVPFIVERIGRRGVMLAAVATMIVAAGVLAAWKALPGLLLGRLLTGVSVGLAAGTAITYLIELRLRADPNASPALARTIGTSVNVGALGIGPLVAGCLAAWVIRPLTVPYLVWIALGAVALIGLATAPETAAPTAKRAPFPVRLPVAAGAATLAAFAANGLFAGLSGLFLATTFHNPSHALAGATLFIVFSAGVVSQLATARLRASHVFALGTISMLVGLVLLVTAVRLSTPSLALFLDQRRPDRRGRGRRLQGDDRPRARRDGTREPRGDELGVAHRALRRALGSRHRRGSRARPGCKRAEHRARLRHPRRARSRRCRMGAARAQAERGSTGRIAMSTITTAIDDTPRTRPAAPGSFCGQGAWRPLARRRA